MSLKFYGLVVEGAALEILSRHISELLKGTGTEGREQFGFVLYEWFDPRSEPRRLFEIRLGQEHDPERMNRLISNAEAKVVAARIYGETNRLRIDRPHLFPEGSMQYGGGDFIDGFLGGGSGFPNGKEDQVVVTASLRDLAEWAASVADVHFKELATKGIKRVPNPWTGLYPTRAEQLDARDQGFMRRRAARQGGTSGDTDLSTRYPEPD